MTHPLPKTLCSIAVRSLRCNIRWMHSMKANAYFYPTVPCSGNMKCRFVYMTFDYIIDLLNRHFSIGENCLDGTLPYHRLAIKLLIRQTCVLKDAHTTWQNSTIMLPCMNICIEWQFLTLIRCYPKDVNAPCFHWIDDVRVASFLVCTLATVW